MRCYFLGVSFLKCFNSFVVLFELFDLLFKFLTSVIEPFLQIHHLQLHVIQLFLMSFLHLLLLLLDLLLVGLERFLGLVLFSQVSWLQLIDFFFPITSFLSTLKGVLLFSYDSVGGNKQLFDFLFVSIIVSCLCIVIFFVFAMQVKNNFSELRYFLRHLVVCLLGNIWNHFI